MSQRGIGYVAIFVGAFMALGIALNLGKGFGAAAYVLALLFCAALPVGVGVTLLRGRRGPAIRAEQAVDSELLRLAERRGGSLTVAEVVAHADLSRDEAERRLERFCERGMAEHRVSEGGVIVYRFEALLDENEKRRATGVLDA